MGVYLGCFELSEGGRLEDEGGEAVDGVAAQEVDDGVGQAGRLLNSVLPGHRSQHDLAHVVDQSCRQLLTTVVLLVTSQLLIGLRLILTPN